MARRSARLAPATKTAPEAQSADDMMPTASITIAPMNRAIVPRPAPLPVKPGVVTFLDIPGEIRNQIYGELLPDKNVQAAERTKRLREDGQRTSTRFMATCHQVYAEAVSILYPQSVPDRLRLKVDSAGTTTFLGKKTRLCATEPSNFSVITRAKSLSIEIEVGMSLASIDVCDVQDAMFNFAKILGGAHQLESIWVNIDIGSDPAPRSMLYDYEYGMLSEFDWDSDDMYGYWRRGNNLGRMQEFRNVKPGDISRAHIAAFLMDALRMIRGVKNGPKYKVLSLDFPAKTGRPWRDIRDQVYNLIRGDTAVPDYAVFTRYFDALRQLKRIYSHFGSKKKDKSSNPKERETFEKHAEDLSKARIRGDIGTFRNAHLTLLQGIDSSIARRIDFNKCIYYDVAELKEHWCRELTYLKIELEAALPRENLDVSFRGYNIADAGLREWQTVGRKEAREAKRKRKADNKALMESVKKARMAQEGDREAEQSDADD